MMNRREFFKSLVIGVAGLYVPKTLYFDMKPRLVPVDRAFLIAMARRIAPSMGTFDLIGVQPLTEPISLIMALKEKSVVPDAATIRRLRNCVQSMTEPIVNDANDNWYTTFPMEND